MSVTTISTATFHGTEATRQPRLTREGVRSALAAAGVTELFVLAARLAHVPMRAADPGAASAKAIPVGGIAMAVLMNAAVGLLFAAALARWAKAPARTFGVVATTYAALSLLGPVFATHTHLATKLVLAAAHVIAAAIIIPRVSTSLEG